MAAGERTFRPRATLTVCVGLAVTFVAGAAFLLATLSRSPGEHTFDRVAIVVVAAIAVIVSFLMGRVRAVADDGGLVVRNPLRTRRYAWAEIVAVRFGRDDPWVALDLADGTSVPVIAIQASDGARSRRDAAWLRARVAESEGREPG